MKPYIAIAEKTKADAMKLFDEDFGVQINFVKFALPLRIFPENPQSV